MTKPTRVKTQPPQIRRKLKLKPEQVHKLAKSYDRGKTKIRLKKLLKM